MRTDKLAVFSEVLEFARTNVRATVIGGTEINQGGTVMVPPFSLFNYLTTT